MMSFSSGGRDGNLTSKADLNQFEDADLNAPQVAEPCQLPVASNDDAVESTITFSPPLYKQRYDLVRNILRQAGVTSVCDFGCAECRALALFRSIETVQSLMGVDIDRRLLVDSSHRLDPLICDFLFRRLLPLHIDLFHGSLVHYDHRLKDVDAVTLIEVVEHLYEEDLAQLPKAIFGNLSPRIVVMTTPNAEFNVLFPTLVGFRHPDHKFEWTRHQFEEWCSSISNDYSYSVVFGGVGEPPASHSDVGHCSQYAMFTRRAVERIAVGVTLADDSCTPYERVYSIDYPAAYKPETVEEAVLIEAHYFVNLLSNSDRTAEDGGDDGNDVISIPFAQLMSFTRMKQACNGDVDLLRRVVKSADFEVSADDSCVLVRVASRCSSRNSLWDDSEMLSEDNCVIAETARDESCGRSVSNAEYAQPSAPDESWD